MHKKGYLDQAEKIYADILASNPNHADSLHLLGVIADQRGQVALAIAYIARAILLRPEVAIYYGNLGNALYELGRLDEALTHYRTALTLKGDSPEIINNIANILRDRGLLEEAASCYSSAISINKNLPELYYNLANVLCSLGRMQEAETQYLECIRLRPDYAEAYYNLGEALLGMLRSDEAGTTYRMALRLRPNYPEAHNNLGIVLQESGRLAEAEAAYHAALRLNPGFADAHYNLGCALLEQNKLEEAGACFQRACELKPGFGKARFALCMAQLPIIYEDEAEIARRRAAYKERLIELSNDPGLGDLARDTGSSLPFFLPYQGYNDRDLQSLYGSLIARGAAGNDAPPTLPPPPGPGQKIRVGIVSGFFCNHTVWSLFIEGWLKHLDRQRFEIFAYHTGSKEDAATRFAAASADKFVQGRFSGDGWRKLILGDAPHVLLYPETGIDPVSMQLAAQRLASVQCCAWGHPETSGLPAIDYFLSSEMMEPNGSQDHYTEQLVLLPNLATCYEPPKLPETACRESFELRPSATVYWSGQALYKYHPRYDHVFPRIAQRAGDCQFVFIAFAKSPDVTAVFRKRLERAFAAYGLNAADYCVILPQMPQDRFLAAVGQCDVILDTIGWSGGKSALDCLAQDLPAVTMAGPLMRGRHTAAILRRMGITETITENPEDYIDVAVRLGRDISWRSGIKKKIAGRKHVVYRDREYISGLEAFLSSAVHRRLEMAA